MVWGAKHFYNTHYFTATLKIFLLSQFYRWVLRLEILKKELLLLTSWPTTSKRQHQISNPHLTSKLCFQKVHCDKFQVCGKYPCDNVRIIRHYSLNSTSCNFTECLRLSSFLKKLERFKWTYLIVRVRKLPVGFLLWGPAAQNSSKTTRTLRRFHGWWGEKNPINYFN